MDAVEGGESFTVTRGGRGIGELTPARPQRQFVSRAAFVASSRHASLPDLDRFRADLDAATDSSVTDPYVR